MGDRKGRKAKEQLQKQKARKKNAKARAKQEKSHKVTPR